MAYEPPIRLGMVGGGEGAFIGAVHRLAARMDDHFELVAGALSSTPERAAASAAALGLDPGRSYADFATMARTEAARPDGIEVVAIVTPNHTHFAIAKAFLRAGIHVICDKPITGALDQARALADCVAASGRLFIVTYNYSGYPMVRQARQLAAAGALGALRLVEVEYVQGWLSQAVERQGSKQAAWRTDPAQAGAGGALGDIGVHAYHLAGYVCGQEPDSLLAELSRFAPGRQLDDNAAVLMRYASGARGRLWASQVAVGEENEISLRIYGDRGALAWRQRRAEELELAIEGQPRQVLTRAQATGAACAFRVPPGHPEGYLEAFANIYAEAADAILAARRGSPRPLAGPTVEDGLRGLRFVDACVRSDAAGGVWTAI